MPEETKKFKCPHCHALIDGVKYECYTSGKEWGRAYINKEGFFENYDCDDSETNDTSDYEYECPECGHSIYESDFENQTLEEDEREEKVNEDNKPIEYDEDEELEELLSAGDNEDLPDKNEYFHCPKCSYPNFINRGEKTCDCVNCGKEIIINKLKPALVNH